MQDSRIKILRARPSASHRPKAPSCSLHRPAALPSGADFVSKIRIPKPESLHNRLRKYMKKSGIFQNFMPIIFQARSRPKLQSAKTPCGALGGQSVFTVGERSGRDVRNRSEREAEAVPRRSGVPRKPTGAGAFREYTRPCVLCKTFSPGRARVPNPPGLRRNEKTTVADRCYSASVSYPSRPAPHISRKTAMPTSAMAIMAM